MTFILPSVCVRLFQTSYSWMQGSEEMSFLVRLNLYSASVLSYPCLMNSSPIATCTSQYLKNVQNGLIKWSFITILKEREIIGITLSLVIVKIINNCLL